MWPLKGWRDWGEGGVRGGGKLGRRIVVGVAVDPTRRARLLLHLAVGEKVPLSEEERVEQLLTRFDVGFRLPRLLDRAPLLAASGLLGGCKLLVKRRV